jgi:hypothetical protein
MLNTSENETGGDDITNKGKLIDSKVLDDLAKLLEGSIGIRI